MKILLLALFLTACTSTPPVVITPLGPNSGVSPVSGTELAKVKESVAIPSRLLMECGSFTDLADGATLDDLMKVHASDALVMLDCSTRTHELIILLKDAFNLK